MATMKRRVVYLSDEEWEAARLQAKAMDVTMTRSAYIRALLTNGRGVPAVVLDEIEKADRQRTHTGHRDGNPGAATDRFSTRPFTPVPKKGK